MELNGIRDSFERVAKKRKLSHSKSTELVDQVSHEMEEALATFESDTNSIVPTYHKSILTELNTKLAVIYPQKDLSGSQKEVDKEISKHQKTIDKILIPDISKACRNVDFDPHTLNQIIANHFYREGQFEIAESLMEEANEPQSKSLGLQFQQIFQVLSALKSKNLEPALNWISVNSEQLNLSCSDLELKCRKLQFIGILQNQDQDAIKFARTHLSPLASNYMNEIQKLMCCLCWVGRLEKSPYAEFLDPLNWEKLAEDFMYAFCELTKQPYRDPLSASVAAGVEGLPSLLKLVNVMAAAKGEEWEEMKELPVPIELGKEFQFHSVFVCPVSREQGSEENPPMMLPCGHVLCKQSIHRLSKGNTRGFKCPYCPLLLSSVALCKELHF